MGCRVACQRADPDKAVFAVEQAVRRAEERCGKIVIHSRYHRLPRRIEDDYECSSEILGNGMNGSVIKGRCRRTGRVVAVKSFKLEGMSSKQLAQLECEIEVFLVMNHPHVADLMDVYRGDDQLDLVMECLSGGEVLQRVLEQGFFDEQVTSATLRQMLLAVNYIHTHNIVHRDLKLENFLYEKKDGSHMKLIDFGFSRVWKEDESAMGMALGSLHYVAPEVLNRSYGSKCDTWSIGVIAFVLLTGGFPFAGSSRGATLRRIQAGDREELEVSVLAEGFVDSLLVVDPKARMTAEQALRHPFIEDTGSKRAMAFDGTDEMQSGVSKALTDFAQVSRFRRVCMSFMAWSLTSEEQSRVRDAFMAIDESRQGTITLEEMVKALKVSGVDDEQARVCFDVLDADKTGHVKYSEFLAAMVSTRIAMNDELIRRTFHRFDKASTGHITLEDLKQLLGESFDGTEIQEMLKEADFEQNGVISLEEFTRFLVGDNAPEKATTRKNRHCLKTLKLLGDQERELRRLSSVVSSDDQQSIRKLTDLSFDSQDSSSVTQAALLALQKELEASRSSKRLWRSQACGALAFCCFPGLTALRGEGRARHSGRSKD